MLASQTTGAPGVYYQRVDASPPRVNALRTDVAGFVGIARRGPLHRAIPVNSWRQFLAFFGDVTGAAYLAYSVRAFFENGGRKCWVVRVASDVAATASTIVPGLSGPAVDFWQISAFGPGVWGNGIELTLRETHRAQTRTITSISEPESSLVESTSGFSRATHVRLSQDPGMFAWKVVSEIDAAHKRIFWVHPKIEGRLPYDSPLTGFDHNRPVVIESVDYTIVLRESRRVSKVYSNLSLVPEHPRYGPELVRGLVAEEEAGVIQGILPAPDLIRIGDLRDPDGWIAAGLPPLARWDETMAVRLPIVSDVRLGLRGGADGLSSLSVWDFLGEPDDALASDIARLRSRRGLRSLEDIPEVSILAVPDILIRPRPDPVIAPLPPCIPDPCLPSGPPAAAPNPPQQGDLPPVFSDADIFQVQSAMIAQCERLRDRMAIIDAPFSAAREDAAGVGAVRVWRNLFDSKYAALYYPWIRVVDPLRVGNEITRDIPPSGHVAGQYALNDVTAGVHKAPANAVMQWIQDVTAGVSEPVHGLLNSEGINVIRAVAGRGLRIYGARTVSSDSSWRFVNVRRLMMMIEKAIEISVQWAAFEPNDVVTRSKLSLTIHMFLLTLWQQGALAGDTAEESFFVKCDEENNPPSQRERGELLCEVGVAPSHPFEFIIVRVGRVNNEFEISESDS